MGLVEAVLGGGKRSFTLLQSFILIHELIFRLNIPIRRVTSYAPIPHQDIVLLHLMSDESSAA